MNMAIIYLLVLGMSFELAEVQYIGCPDGCQTCGGGVHCTSCKDGFHLYRDGAYMQCKKCSSRCTECYGYFAVYCVACADPKCSGTDCSKICSKGCLNSTCDKDSGACQCRDNYEGSHCDRCRKGKYGKDDDCVMICPQNCKRCISGTHCTDCQEGFFGDICEFNCPRRCKFGKCYKNNGTCSME